MTPSSTNNGDRAATQRPLVAAVLAVVVFVVLVRFQPGEPLG